MMDAPIHVPGIREIISATRTCYNGTRLTYSKLYRTVSSSRDLCHPPGGLYLHSLTPSGPIMPGTLLLPKRSCTLLTIKYSIYTQTHIYIYKASSNDNDIIQDRQVLRYSR